MKKKKILSVLLAALLLAQTAGTQMPGYMKTVEASQDSKEVTYENLQDFENGETGKWRGIGRENLEILEESGNHVLKVNASLSNQYVLNQDTPPFKDGKVSFRFKTAVEPGGNAKFGFTFRHAGENGDAPTFMQTPVKGKWNLYQPGHDSAQETGKFLKVNEWNDIEMEIVGNKYVLKINGEVANVTEKDGYNSTLGYCGFKFTDGDKDAKEFYVDDFKVSIYDEEIQKPAPTFTITPDEEHMEDSDLYGRLWYNKPAEIWDTQALPLGNGSMGAMVFGKVDVEQVQMNEITLWDGGPNSPKYKGHPYNKADSSQYVDQFMEEYYGERRQNELTSISNKLTGDENAFGAYQNYGTLKIDLTDELSGQVNVSNYRRSLNLNEGCEKVDYQIDGVDYSREYFVSYPDDIMVIHLSASAEDALNFTVCNEVDDSPSKVSTPNKSKTYSVKTQDHTITTIGTIVNSDIDFASQIKVIAPGAEIVDQKEEGKITVRNGEDVLLLVSIKTDYANETDQFADPDNPPDYKDGTNPLDKVVQVMDAAVQKSAEELKAAHLEDYKEYFDRADLKLGESSVAKIPTNELLISSQGKKDRNPYIDELLFKYGRYLLLSSSRNSELGANLQGLWNRSNQPPWNADYHYNVNIQMIYWPAYVANLPEMAKSYINQIEKLQVPGRTTAKAYHGVDEGFVFHMKTNAFGFTAPGSVFSWGWSPGSSSWALQNVWEYYTFLNDKAMLKETIYPLLRGNAEFWLANLKEDPENPDKLISAPSFSPEQGPRTVATTFDQELIWQLFSDTIEAYEELGDTTDAAFIGRLREAKENLDPLSIGTDGQIKEWREEAAYNKNADGQRLPGTDDHHRHVSQLLGLYPGKHITMDTPEYMEAAKKSLILRTNEGTGWSKAHKLNLWARTGDSLQAFETLTSFIRRSTDIAGDMNAGGVYDNLLSSHSPYQMDGNEGVTSGISEMLLQSQGGYIQPIPTLPAQWESGSFRGLLARNNFEVSASWEQGVLEQMEVLSKGGKECIVQYEGINRKYIVKEEGQKIPVRVTEKGKQIAFDTTAGKTYTIERGVDKASLQEILSEGETKLNQTDVYTKGSLDALKVIMEDAAKLLDKSTDQEEINEAKKSVEDAIAALELLEPENASLELDVSELVLYTGEIGSAATIHATVTGPSRTVIWSVDDENVAVVKDGAVTAKAAGKTVITAEANGIKAACRVEVKKGADSINIETVEAEEATLDPVSDFTTESDMDSHAGGHIRTQKKNAALTLKFTGIGIKFYTKKGSSAGMVEVSIDGNVYETIDEYVSGDAEFQTLVFEQLNLSQKNAEHTLVFSTSEENPHQIATPWYNFDYFEVYSIDDSKPEQVTVRVHAKEGGTASGTATVEKGETITITASPDSGYAFLGWFLNEQKISDEPSYQVTANADAEYVAKFWKLQPEKVRVQVTAGTGGKATGGGTVEKGSLLKLSGEADAGYEFEGWYLNGRKVAGTSVYEILAVADASYEARFLKTASLTELTAVTGIRSKSKTTSVKLTWKKVDGANGYEIERLKGKKWIVLKRVEANQFTVKGLKHATKYTYRIQAYRLSGGERLYGQASKAFKSGTAPKKVSAVIKKDGIGCVKLTWKKGVRINGYVISMKTGKGKYTKGKTLKAKARSFKKSGLKKGKTYTFQIKAYLKVGNKKIFSAPALKRIKLE